MLVSQKYELSKRGQRNETKILVKTTNYFEEKRDVPKGGIRKTS